MNSPEIPRWRKLALVLYMFLVTGTFGFVQPFVPLFLTASGLSRGQLGLVLGISTATALLFQPLLGKLSDRLDARRPLMFFAALVAGGAYLGLGRAAGFWWFLGLTILGGNGFGYLNTVGGVLVGRLVSAERGGAGYARYRVWGSVGYIVVTLLTGLLLASPRPGMTRETLAPIFAFGPLLFFLIALIACFVPDLKRPVFTVGAPQALPADPAREANLRRFLLAFALYTFALYGASGFLSLYMRQLGATGTQVTWMFAAGVLCEVLVMAQIGRWTDVHGRKPALAAAFLLMPVRLLLYIPALGPLWVIAVQSLHGLNFGIVGAVSVAFVNDHANDHNRGAAQARLAAVTGIATALGQAACGALSQRFGIGGMFAAMSAVGALAAWVLVARVNESLPRRI